MDNDDKIKKESKELASSSTQLTAKDFIPQTEVHKDVRMFLDSELASIYQQTKLQSYNLEKEYSETRKHKSPLPWVILGLCFAVVLATVVIMTTVINTKDKNITVEMNVFDDLNLKDLLDSISKIQANYDNAKNQRSALISNREAELRNAESKREQDIFVIKSMKLSAKEEKSRINQVENDYNLALQNIQNNFETKMTEIETEIEEYEAQLAKYDSSKVQAAQEQEKLLNSERRVQELERRKLSQQYEAQIAELEQTIEALRNENNESVYKSVSSVSSKYQAEINGLDPIIVDEEAEEIITKFRDSKSIDFSSSARGPSTDDETISSSFDEYQSSYDDFNYLYSIISSLPQKNSIPLYVAASKNLVNKMGETFSKTTLSLEDDKVMLSGKVNSLEGKVDKLNDNYSNLTDEYNSLTDEYNSLTDEYNTLADEMTNLQEQHQSELVKLEQEKKEMQADFEKTQAAQKKEFEKCLAGIITSAKAQAAVISAESKNNIRIYVLPSIASLVSASGVPAEIKAAKSIKGSIVKDSDEYFRFVPASDKNGQPLDFDFSTVTSGLIVKLTIKK